MAGYIPVIGLTGGIGTGKSTVTRVLEELGAVVIDADKVGHQIYLPDLPAWREIVETFGAQVLNADRAIDRQALGKIVFADPEALRTLNRIVHPKMFDRMRELIADMRAHEGKPTSGPFVGRPVLILTTIGARSGQPRETPLVYTSDGDRLVVIASKGGAPTHPDWYRNLVAHPTVTVEVLGERFRARARVTEGDERERLFRKQADRMPNFYEYQKRTSRRIPVIALERMTD
jgi:deazaflavin-dependent oxidoreductase (nitroreductase family)